MYAEKSAGCSKNSVHHVVLKTKIMFKLIFKKILDHQET